MTSDHTPTPGAVSKSRKNRAASLDALHDVEHRASAPARGRSDAWESDLRSALVQLKEDLRNQHDDSLATNSLLSEIKAEAPRLTDRANAVLVRETALSERVQTLLESLDGVNDDVEIERIRSDLADITREMRDVRALEAEIIYDAYYVDIGIGD